MAYRFLGHEWFKAGMVVAMALGTSHCHEQHRFQDHKKSIALESAVANAATVRLAADGSLPTKTQAAKTSGNSKYDSLCATCHGLDGAADGPAAKAMNPRPRVFVDGTWQKGVDDARLAKVIKEGGASVGLSATMAAWGGMLSEDEIKAMVATVRGFAPK